MKQIKASVMLFALVVLFAAFCAGVMVGKRTNGEEFRIITEKRNQTIAAKPASEPETTEATTAPPSTECEPTETEPSFPININTATAEELMQLPNIGPKLAERIIAYREAYGPFESVKEIDLVEGIGEKTLRDIQDLVTVEE